MRAPPKQSSAYVCTFVDYLGLSILTPVLPFYLSDKGVEHVELWAGAILSAQFVAVIIGNLVWGNVADRYGTKRAFIATMTGDSVLFGLTAVANTPWQLLVVRFFTGAFSPLVPSLTHVFLSLPPEKTSAGLGMYSLTICMGYVVGSSLVGIVYDSLGWLGTSLIPTAAAALALAYVLALPSLEMDQGEREKPSGVKRALTSGLFVVHAASQFLAGWAMNLSFSVLVIHLKREHEWSIAHVSYAFLAVAIMLAFLFLYGVPRLVALLGTERLCLMGSVLLLPTTALLSSPLRNVSGLVFTTLVCLQFASICVFNLPNQGRARDIGDRYTVNGTGAVSGAGRTFFAFGQAASPFASLALYSQLGSGTPWLLLLALIAAILFLHIHLGIWKVSWIARAITCAPEDPLGGPALPAHAVKAAATWKEGRGPQQASVMMSPAATWTAETDPDADSTTSSDGDGAGAPNSDDAPQHVAHMGVRERADPDPAVAMP
mmetsp:Transcript_23225/g.62962  ORF Transcript_23225/g.62962 Transcript_23225/m.62962 type:complete len:489 (-) Transcript_23225:1004-2470(-)